MTNIDVGNTTLGDAYALSVKADKQFRQKAKAAERAPALRPKKREQKALAAVECLQRAIFWRCIAVEYAERDQNQRVDDTIGPSERAARWNEAAFRTRAAARSGKLGPGTQAKALAVAVALRPGEGGVPHRMDGGRL